MHLTPCKRLRLIGTSFTTFAIWPFRLVSREAPHVHETIGIVELVEQEEYYRFTPPRIMHDIVTVVCSTSIEGSKSCGDIWHRYQTFFRVCAAAFLVVVLPEFVECDAK